MSSLHRILWIDQQIRHGRYPNCRIIAEEFEISTRQASRDIEYLRYSLGAPVAYCPRNNGYFYRGGAFILPANFISAEEKATLDYLAFHYRNREGGQARQLAQLFARLGGEGNCEGERNLPIINPGPREVRAYKLLSKAMQSRHKVEIEYVSAAGVKSRRIICPYKFFCQGDGNYVVGYCELRGEVRIFKLERIRGALVRDEEFTIVPWFDPEEYKDDFNYRRPYVALVKTQGENQLRKAGLRVSPSGEPQVYRVEFTNSSKFLAAIIAGVEQFTLLSPRWLRQRFCSRLQKMILANMPEGCDTLCPTPSIIMEPQPVKGGTDAAMRLGAKMGMTWNSYIASVDGALRKVEWWQDEIYKLMGMTGMAFHFIVHETACPSSVTVYDWGMEHFTMLDRIGVHSEIVLVFRDPRLNTFHMIQEDALAKIKASIARGVPAITWAPTGLLEFGLIDGYDDGDEVLFVQDCLNSDPDPLSYGNLGISEVPYLFVQILKGRVEIDPEKIYRDSLEYGLREWNKEQHSTPGYACGRKAYANLISTLERGDYDPFGLAYNLNVYADSKACIAKYLEYVAARSGELKGLEGTIDLYRQVAANYQEITRLVPFTGPGGQAFDPGKAPAVLALVRQCCDLEERAMAEIEKALA
jgi:predicted DNA-binding transcriptional regulator YafY